MMRRLLALVAAAVGILAAVAPTTSLAADGLSLHERKGIELAVRARIACGDWDCGLDPPIAKWRFASNFGSPKQIPIAYLVVPFKNGEGKRQAMLFVFDLYGNRWKYLQTSRVGSIWFSCGTSVLVNQNGWIDQQIRVLRKVARCSP